MRVLFVVPPFAGHVNPTISVGRTLQARGHRVAWLAEASALAQFVPTDLERLRFDDATVERARDAAASEGRNLRGLNSLPFLFEDVLIPMARATYAAVRAHVETWKPDLLVVDQQMLSGAVVARELGVPWATSVSTPAYGVVDPFGDSQKIREWFHAQLAAVEREFELPPSPHPDISPGLVVIYSVKELSLDLCVPNAHFVGAAIADRDEREPFPWERLLPGTRVYLSMGTINADQGARLYAAAIEGLRDLPLQLIAAAPPEFFADAPSHWIVQRRVPQLAVLREVDAVLCHGGLNTVNETLSNGLPLLVAPVRDDQPMTADALVRAGVALRLHLGRVTPTSLRAALQRLLDEPSFRENARVVRAAYARAGGAAAAADLLETFASAVPSSPAARS